MGLPSINIVFKEAASTLIKRTQRGIVALILKEKDLSGIYTIRSTNELPKDSEGVDLFSDYNVEQVKLTLMGTANPPKKVIVYVIQHDSEGEAEFKGYAEALSYLESVQFDYLAVPGEKFLVTDEVPNWIIKRRSDNVMVKGVFPNCGADNEGIINFNTNGIKVYGKDDDGNRVLMTYKAEDYCGRIAGILAGLPLYMSSTYQVLPEVEDVEHFSREDFDSFIDGGEMRLINDGEKVKIARGVNSMVSTSVHKGEGFKKIKIVDTMDMIDSDIRKVAEEYYIGKMPNIYDNKCLLITAIKVYFEQLENELILDKGKNTVGIDIENQGLYLKALGMDVENMDEQQIKEANTKDKVFLESSIKIVDAMENINFNINM